LVFLKQKDLTQLKKKDLIQLQKQKWILEESPAYEQYQGVGKADLEKTKNQDIFERKEVKYKASR